MLDLTLANVQQILSRSLRKLRSLLAGSSRVQRHPGRPSAQTRPAAKARRAARAHSDPDACIKPIAIRTTPANTHAVTIILSRSGRGPYPGSRRVRYRPSAPRKPGAGTGGSRVSASASSVVNRFRPLSQDSVVLARHCLKSGERGLSARARRNASRAATGRAVLGLEPGADDPRAPVHRLVGGCALGSGERSRKFALELEQEGLLNLRRRGIRFEPTPASWA